MEMRVGDVAAGGAPGLEVHHGRAAAVDRLLEVRPRRCASRSEMRLGVRDGEMRGVLGSGDGAGCAG